MNKQKLSYVIAGIMILSLIGLSIADVLPRADEIITLNKTSNDILKSRNITKPDTTASRCDGNYCEFKMWQFVVINSTYNYTYNLGTHRIPERKCLEKINKSCVDWKIYNSNELQVMKKDLIKKWLERYAEVLNIRDNRDYDIRLGEGTITLNDK